MTDCKSEAKISAIRKRAEAQQSRYGFRWNQILRDRRDLLIEVDRMRDALLAIHGATGPNGLYENKALHCVAAEGLSVTRRATHE